MRKMSCCRVLAGVLLACVLGAASAAAENLGALRDRLGVAVDSAAVTVSGLSSGGYMAHQLHLAHSRRFAGAAVLAGGPYACAQTNSAICEGPWSWYAWFAPDRVCQALHICTAFYSAEYGAPALLSYYGPPGHADALAAAEAAATAGRIDPLEGLAGDRVWLFAAGADELVPEGIMNDLAALYRALYDRPDVDTPETAIRFETLPDAAHAMPVEAPGPNDCGREGPPYINDCDFDAAGRLLRHLYDVADDAVPAPDYDAWSRDRLYAFDQTPFFAADDPSVSLGVEGYLYVPESCRGAACPLHVALHGCRQSADAVEPADGDAVRFFEDAGYNAWAEVLGILILYPQTTAWGDAGDLSRNPRGCWDWWGFSGDAYATRDGKQIRAINAMLDCLAGQGPCG